ncbi:MAG: hypothetical protein IJR46_03595 [Neisseriaceae bacterium]|nr:hypothetical protein [Neisseriaceae bacterium]
MTKEELIDYINCGHEIEFRYEDIWYGINYTEVYRKGNFFISFYEANKELSEHLVKTVEALVNIKYNGVTVMEMLESLGDEEDAEKRGVLVIY